METRDSSERAPVPPSVQKPRLYRSPALIAYGSVAKLTQGGSFSATDGANTMMIDPPGLEMMM